MCARSYWSRSSPNFSASYGSTTKCSNGYGESFHASHADERRDHEEAIKRLRGEHKRLGDRINAMYLDKLDGRVDSTFFDKMSAQWREEQNRCLREIERHESAEQSYMDEGVQILELASNARKLFERQEPREKRRLLNFLLSNCSWENGEVVAAFREPFDLLAQTTAIATRAAAGSDPNSAKSEIWLGNYRPHWSEMWLVAW
jgi:site-specific DNA recombinase